MRLRSWHVCLPGSSAETVRERLSRRFKTSSALGRPGPSLRHYLCSRGVNRAADLARDIPDRVLRQMLIALCRPKLFMAQRRFDGIEGRACMHGE
jgi:hypothetical protein